MWLFPLGATAISSAFAVLLGRQWMRGRRPSVLAWCIALAMFAAASLAATVGLLGEWTPGWYRAYYLLGAIVNVPVLALGTIYLLGPRRVAHVAAVVVVVASAFATTEVVAADLNAEALAGEEIPSGRDVMPSGVRTLSRYYSFTGFFVVLGGALFSAGRLARREDPHARNLAAANLLIALGTSVVAVGSGFARYGRGSVFAVSLAVGVVLMFTGFLRTRA